MGTFIFHNKYHKNAHHTVPTSGFPDSASDPIASERYPFLGIFYNMLSIGVSSNSFDWGNVYTSVSSNSAMWNRSGPVFTNVRSNSAFWQNNFSVYNTYNDLSSNLNSTYTTVYTNSSYWNRLYLNTVLYTNESQENTKQKNFATLEIKPNDVSNIILDLSLGQVSYYASSNISNISGFVGAKKGGIYNFYAITSGSCDSTLRLNFNPENFKFPSTYSFVITGTRLGKFEFLSDGTYLHGKATLFDAVGPDDINTLYGGDGIYLEPNPYVFTLNEGVNVGGGLLVQGVWPYTEGVGLSVIYVPPCP
jgi:hypothetical protein